MDSRSISIFCVEKYRMCLGLILATGAFAICNVWYSSRAGMVFALLFLMVSFLKLDFNASILRWGINIVWACILAVVICIFPTIVMLQSFEYPLAKHFEWNVICVLAVVMVLFTITAKWKLSVGLATFSLYLLSTINYFVFSLRGKELNIMDFLSLGTAVSVADNYEISAHSLLAYSWIIWLLLVYAGIAVPTIKNNHCRKIRVQSAVITLGLVAVLSFGTNKIPIQSWGRNGTTENGYYLNFYLGFRDAHITKPEGYSLDVITQYQELEKTTNQKIDRI